MSGISPPEWRWVTGVWLPSNQNPQHRPHYTHWLTAAFLLNETAKCASQWAEGRPTSPSLGTPAVCFLIPAVNTSGNELETSNPPERMNLANTSLCLPLLLHFFVFYLFLVASVKLRRLFWKAPNGTSSSGITGVTNNINDGLIPFSCARENQSYTYFISCTCFDR